ncbi:TetR/AcrR family transcriptional regulator [Cytobacillus sp. FJAT-54145]|uniref:TetR/AcrR family transcriptional regulator n=1 Tax=Cytobacillus spartinae TaxID=3299023 RepID=A0ABW6KFN0_9BACI
MVKKQLIMERALELFAQQGIDATSVQQITDHCGISKGAFYLAYKSKDELILAMIDHFMMQFTSDLDYVVKNTNNDQLLYEFYYTIYSTFQKHSDFAKILIKEQSQSLNNDLFLKIQYYDSLMGKSILLMLERLYGEEITPIKFDLFFCIRGFMNTYSHLFLFFNLPLDLEILSKSLVEKTNLLARHSTIPFISEEVIQLVKHPKSEEVSKEQLVEMVVQKIDEIEEPIEKESLILLKEQLVNQTYSPAIIKGLLENIKDHPQCKWISYLLRNYFDF